MTTKEEIRKQVSKEIDIFLTEISEVSGELELNEKQYVVIPLEKDFVGLVTKAIDLAIEKTRQETAKEVLNECLKERVISVRTGERLKEKFGVK